MPLLPRALDLRPRAVVFDRRQRLAIEIRIANDDAVGGDERDTSPDEPGKRIGLRVELGLGGRLAVRECFGGEPCLADERALDALVGCGTDRPRHEHRCDNERDCRGDERSKEEASAECHGRSTSLYPNCLMVSMLSESGGSFSRRRRMWTSTVRVPPV